MTTVEEPQRMQIKSYFTGTVAAAMDQARRELGPDALLLNSREAPAEARHMGEYEVVFALAPAAGAARRAPRPAPAMELPAAPYSEFAAVYARLTASGVDEELAEQIVQAVQARMTAAGASGLRAPRRLFSRDPEALRRHLLAELEGRFEVDGDWSEGERARVAALVGPPGSGKTTTLVKLAVRYGLTARRPVQLLSMDTCRIGGAEQLRTFAGILGVGFQALETVHALGQALEEHRAKSLILIDTHGYSPATLGDGADLAAFLAAHGSIDTHLVLPASMKPTDVARAVERFDIFQPGRLLFTRLDETDTPGSLFSEAARTGRPISFLGTGPSIPEDLEPAAKGRVTELVLGEAMEAAVSAA